MKETVEKFIEMMEATHKEDLKDLDKADCEIRYRAGICAEGDFVTESPEFEALKALVEDKPDAKVCTCGVLCHPHYSDCPLSEQYMGDDAAKRLKADNDKVNK